jgi:O-Antigen ligase
LLWFEPGGKKVLVGGALVVLPTLLIATGAKGPLVATPLTLAICLIFFGEGVLRYLPRMLLIGVLSAGVLWFSLPLLPGTSLFRVGTFVVGQFGSSEMDRTSFYTDTLSGIVATPQGLGLGGFASKFGVGGGEIREFPHNIILEVFLEGGWLAGLFFPYLLWRGLKGVFLLGKSGKEAWLYELLLCFTLFSLLNDLVSGELNDSKVLMAFLGLSIGLTTCPKENAVEAQKWSGKDDILAQRGSETMS